MTKSKNNGKVPEAAKRIRVLQLAPSEADPTKLKTHWVWREV